MNYANSPNYAQAPLGGQTATQANNTLTNRLAALASTAEDLASQAARIAGILNPQPLPLEKSPGAQAPVPMDVWGSIGRLESALAYVQTHLSTASNSL